MDPEGICTVGTIQLALAGPDAGRRIVSWTLRGARVGDPRNDTSIDGLRTTVSHDPPPTAAPAEHANGVTVLDHLVVVTPDSQRTTEALASAGFPLRRVRETDAYGPPFFQSFFRAGETIIELIGPQEPSGDRPARFFGLAFTVADLDATHDRLGAGLSTPKDAVQPGRRIATLRHASFGMSVATAFMTVAPGADR